MDLRIVISTFPNIETAEAIGGRLVAEKLAACVNLLPSVKSIYQWEGRIESADEIVAIFKTTAEHTTALRISLEKAHPYDVPEIIILTPESATAAYSAWVRASLI